MHLKHYSERGWGNPHSVTVFLYTVRRCWACDFSSVKLAKYVCVIPSSQGQTVQTACSMDKTHWALHFSLTWCYFTLFDFEFWCRVTGQTHLEPGTILFITEQLSNWRVNLLVNVTELKMTLNSPSLFWMMEKPHVGQREGKLKIN